MARLHHKSSTAELSCDELAGIIQRFVESCRRPAALEYGEELIELAAGNYILETRGNRIWLEAWNNDRALSRRILALSDSRPGLLECQVHRFAKTPGRLTLLDLDRPSNGVRTLAGERRNFGEQFRRMLNRQFPGWDVKQLSASRDLQRSFSASYPRAKLLRGHQSLVAVACPAAELESGCLTAALLWFDYQYRRAESANRPGLALFLPEGAGGLTAQRLKHLTRRPLQTRIFLFNEHGAAGEVDPEDLGNIDTRVGATDTPSRDPGALSGKSEVELESAVRKHIQTLDATLLTSPVHHQVLTFLGCERNLIDLLAVDSSGRLCVLELKTTEDLHLPMQALDYWMRVRWHANRGELNSLFPCLHLSAEPPRLLLIAPATAFHPTNQIILRYFSPEIDVERIGVNSDWIRRLTVVMRLRGADAPISHETEFYVDSRPDPDP